MKAKLYFQIQRKYIYEYHVLGHTKWGWPFHAMQYRTRWAFDLIQQKLFYVLIKLSWILYSSGTVTARDTDLIWEQNISYRNLSNNGQSGLTCDKVVLLKHSHLSAFRLVIIGQEHSVWWSLVSVKLEESAIRRLVSLHQSWNGTILSRHCSDGLNE